MTTALDLITAFAWWAMLATWAVVASILTLAVFFHAFPNGGGDR